MARSRKTTTELLPQPRPDAPLDSRAFLQHAQPVLATLTEDLLARADASPGITRALQARHAQEKTNDLTADAYAVWRRNVVEQIAAAWLLSCVFVRTLEDRGLLGSPGQGGMHRIAGPGAMGAQHTFFQIAPYLTERDYLLAVFRELEHVPATRALFDREHNLAWRLAPSAAATKTLLDLFRTPTPEAPAFRFGQADTRFLGDLYQDLSEDVRKRFALLQTPDFIESFILDRTLEPAIEAFGLEETTLLDPTCGSGHFLLGAFERLFERWIDRGKSREEAVARALDAVVGVDINPYAVSIANFRLTLAGLARLEVRQLSTAPRLPTHAVVADSLLDGGFAQLPQTDASDWGEAFNFIDEAAAKEVLRKSYAAVVGNPPYITVKDPAMRERYRKMYESAGGKYALSAPFMERFFLLARPGGYVGQITANSFMKREFGKGLVEKVLPREDVQLIVNTAGAYIPGHGTPTVLLFGRHRSPESQQVHAILARRGEPSTPEDPANGEVWSSIRDHWEEVGFENDYITVEKVEREQLAKHPWSLEGGGAGELKALLEERAEKRLGDIATAIGFDAIMGEDEIFYGPGDWIARFQISSDQRRELVTGEQIRDWSVTPSDVCIFPYDDSLNPLLPVGPAGRHLWRYRTALKNRMQFGKNTLEAGLAWFEYRSFYKSKRSTPLSIAFAFVATHNHFVLDRGGKVFNRSAPIIKLPDTATEDDHLALLAYLNSSTACFWMKQVFSPKGMHNGSEANATPFLVRYEFDGTKLARLPVPEAIFSGSIRNRLITLARTLEECATFRAATTFASLLQTGESLEAAVKKLEINEQKAVAAQEAIDWIIYEAFGLVPTMNGEYVDQDLRLGARPFELRIARGECEPGDETWFRWLELDPPNVDDSLLGPTTRRALKILESTEASRSGLRSLESGRSKRRWRQPVGKAAQNVETAESRLRDEATSWFANQVELLTRTAATPTTCLNLLQRLPSEWETALRLIDETAKDATVVGRILEEESVPFLPALMLTEAGMEKRMLWEATWRLQRDEDAGARVWDIPVPPPYDQKEFRAASCWRLRGKLDVPKERFISYPGCESDNDGEPVYGWAGWDHAQRAKALAALYVDRKDNEGWSAERLQPMLAGLLELLPWVKQWHPEPDPDTGEPFGAFLETWLEGECQTLGFTFDDLRAWRPTKSSGRAKKAASSATKKKTAKKQPEASDDAAPVTKKKTSKRAKKAAASES